ncbi:MAG: hypothetical protein HYZ00_13040, partial [Candidatus Hydrogenedentes bacterium]|nr:hypothetical protein [Candidatus Hydrogenedentota bacterium]
ALREGANDPTRAVAQVYALALGRAPADDELAQSLDFLQQQTQRHSEAGAQAGYAAFTDFCQVVLNLNEFVYVD